MHFIAGIRGLDLFEVGPWLAQQLPKSAAHAPSPRGPEADDGENSRWALLAFHHFANPGVSKPCCKVFLLEFFSNSWPETIAFHRQVQAWTHCARFFLMNFCGRCLGQKPWQPWRSLGLPGRDRTNPESICQWSEIHPLPCLWLASLISNSGMQSDHWRRVAVWPWMNPLSMDFNLIRMHDSSYLVLPSCPGESHTLTDMIRSWLQNWIFEANRVYRSHEVFLCPEKRRCDGLRWYL